MAKLADCIQYLEQLRAERRRGLGGSDAGAVLEINPWATPLDVYLEKVEGHEREETEPMRWGRILEPAVALEWSRRTGHRLRTSPTLWHPDHSWMLGHVDRLGTIIDDGREFVYEGKAVSLRMSGDWGASGQTFPTAEAAAYQIPAPYVCQACHYMAVADLDLAVIVVFIGGQELRWYWLRRDPGFERVLVDRLGAFWNRHVLARVPPDPIRKQDIAKLYKPEETAVVADAHAITALMEFHRAHAAEAAAKEDKERARFRLTRTMGSATELVDADGRRLATWRREGSRTYRTFRASTTVTEPDL
ncbi:MAG: YqaJ viral recombinase family protein [Acidobacteria bacterium]|nr:YqaJ viral recombinase family protein [Acidobacteriota bacterium]